MSQRDHGYDQLTVAVLGTGRQGNAHLAALARLRDEGVQADGHTVRVEPVLYGRDPKKVAELAERYGVHRTSADLEEILDAPDVAVIDNCLVNSMHYTPLMRAIEQGKHVLSEKPLTTNLADGERLLAAARAACVHHGIIQHMRFTPGPVRAKELIEAGQLGRIFSANALFGYMVPQTITNRPTWFYKRELAGGGIVEDVMTHLFDLLRFLIGPITSVYAATGIAWKERREPTGAIFPVTVEDIASVVIKFANGATGHCFTSWARRRHEEVPQFQIDGEDASLLFGFNQLMVQRQEENRSVQPSANLAQTDPEGWQVVELQSQDPFLAQIRRFLTGIAEGHPSKPDWEDGVTNLRLVTATYRSAAEGREVPLSEMGEKG